MPPYTFNLNSRDRFNMTHQSKCDRFEPRLRYFSSTVYFSLLILIIMATSSTACRTAAGFGEDLQAAGEAIEETSEDIRDSID